MIKGNAIITMLDKLRQWFSGASSTETPQLVYTPELNRRRKKRLESLDMPILCMTPKKPTVPLPRRIHWRPLPESTTPPVALHATARRLVDVQTTAIKAYLPQFFINPELQVDYEPAYKMNRQQILAISGLAFLAHCSENLQTLTTLKNNAISAPLPLILDSPLSPALLEGELARHSLPEFSALFSPVASLHPQDFKKRRVAIKVPHFFRPTVLLVMSAAVHFDLARAAVESLEKSHEIVIYFANPAKLEPALRQKLSQRYFTIDAHTLLPDEPLIQGACNYFNLRLQQIASLPVPAALREALTAELERVSDSMHIITLLETVMSRIKPVAVLGCLEKNRMSLAFKALQSRYPFKLFNFQHGTMPLTHNLDWVQFDRFFIWNPLSRNVILKDGYRWPDSLTIVGNAFWEQTESKQQQPLSKKAQDIIAWRGDSPLIGAYTQYAGDYLTPEILRNYLRALFDYLEARPHVKLLIKKHPVDTNPLTREMLAQRLHLQERVMLCEGKELDLWESFGLIRFSTTICSTTLMDSLKVNVPAVALDFTDIIANIGYGYEQEPRITIIRNPQTVTETLDALLAQTAIVPGQGKPTEPQADTQSLVYPKLPGTYAQRIQQVLIEEGLLAAPEREPAKPIS